MTGNDELQGRNNRASHERVGAWESIGAWVNGGQQMDPL
jgi:hypothetical protein